VTQVPDANGGESPARRDSVKMTFTAKILVGGGFGVGKTTFVGSVSEIKPLRTEEVMTEASIGIDSLDGVRAKSTTTVAMDFGRFTIRQPGADVEVYLFGTPGQERFWFMWNELSVGALGAVVLADTRRLGDCFAAVDFCEHRGLGFLVAINRFPDAHDYSAEQIRSALGLDAHIPLTTCNARDRTSAVTTLTQLVDHLIIRARTGTAAPARTSQDSAPEHALTLP
jgi:uncharacterized protein